MQSTKAGVADIFRHAGRDFAAQFGASVHRGAWRIYRAIRKCRTSAMGARYYQCMHCQTGHVLYNSCRNRHCPTCQGAGAHRWLERQSAKVLPAPYFHIVFTLPKNIAALAYANRTLVFNILMRTTAQTLTAIAADPKRLGVRVGGTCVLHTWNQKLQWHPHTHALVTGGGFDVVSGKWKTTDPKFFAPVKVLSRYFRNRFLNALHHAYCQNQLIFPGSIADLKSKQAFNALIHQARRQEWNVYAKPPFQGPKALIKYLSRYTHRVAIADSRIIGFDGKTVFFRYRKSPQKGHLKPQYATLKLTAAEFIRRFLMHVLPSRFHRIRHFGILSNSIAKQTLEQVQRQTGWQNTTDSEDENTTADHSSPLCSTCSQPMVLVAALTPYSDYLYSPRAPPLPAAA